jgi:hypothetical protein
LAPAFVGLDPLFFQSDKYQARSGKISKRGTPYLKKALSIIILPSLKTRVSNNVPAVRDRSFIINALAEKVAQYLPRKARDIGRNASEQSFYVILYTKVSTLLKSI